MSADLMSNSRSIQGEVCSFLTLKTRHSSPWSPPALLSFLTQQQGWTRGDKAPFCDPAQAPLQPGVGVALGEARAMGAMWCHTG